MLIRVDGEGMGRTGGLCKVEEGEKKVVEGRWSLKEVSILVLVLVLV